MDALANAIASIVNQIDRNLTENGPNYFAANVHDSSSENRYNFDANRTLMYEAIFQTCRSVWTVTCTPSYIKLEDEIEVDAGVSLSLSKYQKADLDEVCSLINCNALCKRTCQSITSSGQAVLAFHS